MKYGLNFNKIDLYLIKDSVHIFAARLRLNQRETLRLYWKNSWSAICANSPRNTGIYDIGRSKTYCRFSNYKNN